MALFWIILLAIVLVPFLYLLMTFNFLITLRNRIRLSSANIDVQLKRRHDLVKNLCDVVSSYAKHEKKTLEKITSIRTSISSSDASLGNAFKSLFAVVENYPDLKAQSSFSKLYDELVLLENDIARSRMVYNDCITKYADAVGRFPSALVAKLFNFSSLEYLVIEEIERLTPTVKL